MSVDSILGKEMAGGLKESAFDVAVISFTTHSAHLNYGATLHGWAFQQILLQMGCSPVVIDYVPRSLMNHHFKWPILDSWRIWRNPSKKILRIIHWLVSARSNLRKYKKFQNFITTRIICTQDKYTERNIVLTDSIPGCENAVFVCEADVIWKRSSRYGFDRGFYLDFPAANGHKKVAYAPSVSSVPFSPSEESRFIGYMDGFSAISSRERLGASYIAKLTGREIPWLIDPTLLLRAEDYAKIAKRNNQSGYVLLYTCMRVNTNMVKEARRLAKRLGKPLVEVGNYGIMRFLFGHHVVDDAGIEEWLGLFMNADVVVCNSFHGICFSLIFEKPFYAFRRNEHDWKFIGICSELGLNDRLIEANGSIPNKDTPIDFTGISSKLSALREKALDFIRENIAKPALGGHS